MWKWNAETDPNQNGSESPSQTQFPPFAHGPGRPLDSRSQCIINVQQNLSVDFRPLPLLPGAPTARSDGVCGEGQTELTWYRRSCWLPHPNNALRSGLQGRKEQRSWNRAVWVGIPLTSCVTGGY